MKFREIGTLIIIGIVVVAAAVGWVSSKFLGKDNKVEEQCEKVIQDETGMTVDLTPSSPEITKEEVKPVAPVAPSDTAK